MISLTFAIGIAVILLIVAGLISLGVWTASSTSSSNMLPEAYIWSIGNADGSFVTSSPIEYPFTKTSTEVSLGLVVQLPVVTTNPTLPILVSLPLAASSLSGVVLYSSHSLPVGQTSIRPVLYDSLHSAFQYVPSGNYIVTGELSTTWLLSFQVIYTLL